MSLPHELRTDWTKPIGLPAVRLFVLWSNGLRSIRSKSVSSSASFLLHCLHNSLQKKIPKVCNIVGSVIKGKIPKRCKEHEDRTNGVHGSTKKKKNISVLGLLMIRYRLGFEHKKAPVCY